MFILTCSAPFNNVQSTHSLFHQKNRTHDAIFNKINARQESSPNLVKDLQEGAKEGHKIINWIYQKRIYLLIAIVVLFIIILIICSKSNVPGLSTLLSTILYALTFCAIVVALIWFLRHYSIL